MGHAWIDGRLVALHAAISEAANLIGACRAPVVAGMGIDVAGARAAIMLAQRIGAALDHMHSEAVLRDLAVRREAGMMVTIASEARQRADVLLLIGADPVAVWPQLRERLAGLPTADGKTRRIFWLCPGSGAARQIETAQAIGRRPEHLPVLLAALRARVAGRPVGKTPHPPRVLDGLAADLCRARFGVAVWSAAQLDALTIEMLCGLVNDLNRETRFSGLALPAADDALGVLEACGWMTGFPMRTGFARGYPEHDPWRFDARRLVESGEADCIIWISAYGAATPQWKRQVPTIALTAPGASFRRAPRVHIEVGRPGSDHDAVEHCPFTGTLVAVPATAPSDAISAEDAIAHIAAALPAAGVRRC
jgi:formylmethanofuran dehydrogenase subunit B